MHASSAARFDHSVRDILGLLEVPGRRHPNADLYDLLRSWLIDTRGRRWFLVLDNADEAEFLLEPPAAACQENHSRPTSSRERRLDYIPTCDHGTVLITTRRRDMCLKMVHRNNLLEVLPMSTEHALEMMQNKIGVQDQKDDIMRLATALDFMPLAMAQAAAYIHKRAPRCSVREFTEKLHRSQESKLSLLKREESDLRRDREASNSIISTWQISFEHVHDVRPSAADLLSLMSFFDRQSIPETLLLSWLQMRSANVSGDGGIIGLADGNLTICQSEPVSSTDQLEEDIQLLRDYSLMSVTSSPESFEMHALVQLATQEWLIVNERHYQWKSRFIKVLSQAFPKYGSKNWHGECKKLFPHAIAALQLDAAGIDTRSSLASLLHNAGSYAIACGAYANAERLISASLNILSRLFGDEHPRVRSATSSLITIFCLQMRDREAEKLQLRLLDLTKSAWGEAHWRTLRCMSQLSSIYRLQNRLEEAEQLSLRVLDLAEDQDDTMSALLNLAETYESQGRSGDAEKLLLHALNISNNDYGCSDEITVTVLFQLGLLQLDQGRLNEAELTLSRTREEREIKLGSSHPETLKAMCVVGILYHRQGRLGEAVLAFSRAQDGLSTTLGDDHPRTLFAAKCLAHVYQQQGRLDGAQEILTRVMEAQSISLGLANANTLESMASLAYTECLQGRSEAAEATCRNILDKCTRLLGIAHPTTLNIMVFHAIILRRMQRRLSAAILMARCAALSSDSLGPTDLDTLQRAYYASLLADDARVEIFRVMCRSEAVWGHLETSGLQNYRTRTTP